jgi:hypothetical protein
LTKSEKERERERERESSQGCVSICCFYTVLPLRHKDTPMSVTEVANVKMQEVLRQVAEARTLILPLRPKSSAATTVKDLEQFVRSHEKTQHPQHNFGKGEGCTGGISEVLQHSVGGDVVERLTSGKQCAAQVTSERDT